MSHSILSLKTTIRTKDLDASKNFYSEILQFLVVEEYDSGNSKGCILRVNKDSNAAFIELSEIPAAHYYYQGPFSESFANDKIDLQIRTNDINAWVKVLKDKWPTKGPLLRPWGSYYLYMRDPDGLQIILYQEKD